jgi:biotin synthase
MRMRNVEELMRQYERPMLDLVFEAAEVHRKHQPKGQVQLSQLLSVKTGGCSEDCAYCPQAARYHTGVEVHPLMRTEQVIERARQAKAEGASRFCMGASWREVRENKDFDRVLDMVEQVSTMGMEVCCTLGMLTEMQAKRLAKAGLHAYNHNLDTGESFYGEIISTRTYQDRLETLGNVRKAGLTVCCGGIIGMGETVEQRMELLATLMGLDPAPESVPLNILVPVEGTPLEEQQRPPFWDILRMIAVTRIHLPYSMVRLSAGRKEMSDVEQAFCFLAGANSIFLGEKLLTTPNPNAGDDMALLRTLGLRPMEVAARAAKMEV